MCFCVGHENVLNNMWDCVGVTRMSEFVSNMTYEFVCESHKCVDEYDVFDSLSHENVCI